MKQVEAIIYRDLSQFWLQLGGATLLIYAFGFTYVTFKLVNAIVPLRVPTETELEGLDIPEFGMTAYPEDALAEAK